MFVFFKKTFKDIKESAKLQYQVDKANFEAVKAESKANFEENKFINSYARAKKETKENFDKARMSCEERKKLDKEKKKEEIMQANKRIEEANARYERAKNK